MPSTNLKRTAATLGVLAGLLATAGPASAMPIYMKYDDAAVVGTLFRGEVIGVEPTMKPPASPTSEVFTQWGRAPAGHSPNGSPGTAARWAGSTAPPTDVCS
jgi:hypothetical protein